TDKWNDGVIEAKYDVDDLFRTLFQYVMEQRKNKKSLSDIGRIQYRFAENKEETKKCQIIKEMTTRITYCLRDLIHVLTIMDQYMESREIPDKYDKDDLKGHMQALQTFIDHLEQFFLLDDSANHVKWVEAEAYGSRNAVYLYSEPAEVATLLAKDFFDKKQSIIL